MAIPQYPFQLPSDFMKAMTEQAYLTPPSPMFIRKDAVDKPLADAVFTMPAQTSAAPDPNKKAINADAIIKTIVDMQMTMPPMKQWQIDMLNQLGKGAFYGNRNPSSPLYGGAFDAANYAAAQRAYFAANRKAEQEEIYRTVPQEGIRAGEIVAWRVWKLDSSRNFLRSSTRDVLWNPSEPMNGDVKHYGVHCWKTRHEALEYVAYYETNQVIGSIKIWGEVIEHENGYRAEFGKVNSIYDIVNYHDQHWAPWNKNRRKAKLLAALRQRYGV